MCVSVCGQAGSGAVSQPASQLSAFMCLCANAVLKWAHYHQREHKHSSRKQDSLCQEREPLPQARCRPDEITGLKIRQGSYYYCRHAPSSPHPLYLQRTHTHTHSPPKQPQPSAAEKSDNPHSCSNILFHAFFS